MAAVPKRRLATVDGISAQGLGCMGMSEFYGDADGCESVATIGGVSPQS